MTNSPELRRAHGAPVGLLSGVYPHVRVELGLGRERPLADGTLVLQRERAVLAGVVLVQVSAGRQGYFNQVPDQTPPPLLINCLQKDS